MMDDLSIAVDCSERQQIRVRTLLVFLFPPSSNLHDYPARKPKMVFIFVGWAEGRAGAEGGVTARITSDVTHHEGRQGGEGGNQTAPLSLSLSLSHYSNLVWSRQSVLN